eukprot:15482240-Alexandrium_andersonii.AAC.1
MDSPTPRRVQHIRAAAVFVFRMEASPRQPRFSGKTDEIVSALAAVVEGAGRNWCTYPEISQVD